MPLNDRDPQTESDSFAVFTRADNDRAVVLELTGQVDLGAEPVLSRTIDAAMDQRPNLLVVDLSQVDLLTSAGMAVLLGSHNRAQGQTLFRIVASGEADLRPLEMLGLTKVMSIFPTLDDALAAAA